VTFWKILGVGVLIPIVTPLFISMYMALVPGNTIGSVDGWLGYLGGYSGGFLAFISAYFIFQGDQKVQNKTVLNFRTRPTAEEDVLTAKYHVYFTEGYAKNIELESETGRVSGVDDYHVIEVQIKNICQNYAAAINLTIGEVTPLIYIKDQDYFSKWGSLAELEGKEIFVFVLHIDPHLWSESNSLDCKLSSYNLQEIENKQSFVLHKGVGGGLTVESKT
jgi:hypothetical protein